MIEKAEREQIIALINREVVPAIGCTEPIAVALCVAKATETLGCRPQKIQVLLSANILKNAMGVGIPGTGMALLHTRSVTVTNPSFTIFRVKKPIQILGMDNVQMELTSTALG